MNVLAMFCNQEKNLNGRETGHHNVWGVCHLGGLRKLHVSLMYMTCVYLWVHMASCKVSNTVLTVHVVQ